MIEMVLRLRSWRPQRTIDDTTLPEIVLGIHGFALRSVRLAIGEVWLDIETNGPAGCPKCGVRATAHDRRRVEVRDLPVMGRAYRQPLTHCPRSSELSQA